MKNCIKSKLIDDNANGVWYLVEILYFYVEWSKMREGKTREKKNNRIEEWEMHTKNLNFMFPGPTRFITGERN